MASEGSKERRTFTFEWQIEKFSHWEHVNPSSALESPQFRSRFLDESVFRLHLYPRGKEVWDSEVTLAIATLIRFSPRVRVDCEWSCLGRDGKPLATILPLANERLTAGSCLHLPPGPMPMEVFQTKKEDYIPRDVLTVRCRIWYSNRDAEEDEYISALTRLDTRVDSFIWPINEFSTLQLNQKVAPPVEVNLFPYQRLPLMINFFLKGKSLEESSVSFEVILRPLTQPLWFCIFISVMDVDGTLMDNVRILKSFKPSPFPQKWNVKKMISRNWLLERGKVCLHDDVLKLLFTGECFRCSGIILASRYGNISVETGSMQSSSAQDKILPSARQHDQLDCISQTTSDSVLTLLYDLQTLFEDHPMSDLELWSGEFAYPVHKNVLSVRSNVFRNMFANEEEEFAIPYLDVEDIDPEILHTFLVYLYTGDVSHLRFRDAVKLYYAAVKYNVPKLKPKCSSVMLSDMVVANVFDVLDVAVRYHDMALASSVSDFIAEHYDRVILSDKWKEFQNSKFYFAWKIVAEVHWKRGIFEKQLKSKQDGNMV